MKHSITLPPNQRGRDYFTGDLHGMFDALQRALDHRGFDPSRDRLICTGDLIDRGPDSPGCLTLLEQPWFFAVCGNHERMMLDSVLHGLARATQLWRQNGGGWAEALPRAHLEQLCLLIEGRMSRLLEVPTPAGPIGVVHAEYPLADWRRRAEIDGDRPLEQALLWSRSELRSGSKRVIDGVARVIHGHSVVDHRHRLGNRVYIDTGAYLNDRVDLFDADQLLADAVT